MTESYSELYHLKENSLFKHRSRFSSQNLYSNLSVGSANLDDVLELLRLGVQRGVELVKTGQEHLKTN
jgi:exonuclease VII small subunit